MARGGAQRGCERMPRCACGAIRPLSSFATACADVLQAVRADLESERRVTATLRAALEEAREAGDPAQERLRELAPVCTPAAGVPLEESAAAASVSAARAHRSAQSHRGVGGVGAFQGSPGGATTSSLSHATPPPPRLAAVDGGRAMVVNSPLPAPSQCPPAVQCANAGAAQWHEVCCAGRSESCHCCVIC